tara:strand:+ start:41823 stop:42428 length:606 start_codon:yes stop_codon:yes gene_type:complete
MFNYMFLKRLIDFLLSLIFIIFTFPVLLIFILLIIIFDQQNPFFTQKRSGLYGIPIKIFKLRSMKFRGDDNEITLFGSFMRKIKVDELPQLINVIRNDMSLIGPRPLYLEFNKYYKDTDINRLMIKPGITGLAQIRVSDATDWRRKFKYDTLYYRKINFNLDLFIIINTIKLIFKKIFFKKNVFIESINYRENFMNNYAKL